MAPPHARGWTLDGAPATRRGSPARAGIDPTGARSAERGSPARAGIDPGAQHTRPGSPARGDRPTPRQHAARSARAPPQGRGSTLRLDAASAIAPGSPRARGDRPMDAGAQRAKQSGLPRTRGDRPHRRRPAGDLTKSRAPPHTRGSTRQPVDASDRRAGWAPPHAGIDPSGPGTGRPIARAPPHTRGSTRREGHGGAPRGRGSPAHAGIDPFAAWPPSARRRLPRTRGDRPPERVLGWRSWTAPPHTRGSTLDAGRACGRSEAPAPPARGDRPALIRRDAERLPRTRGDRTRRA